MAAPTLDDLRRYAIARSLFAPTQLARAITKLGFVQADPIRMPARAQDLTLRHRVAGYRTGDLERRYPKLAVEEDFLVNYGFMPRTHMPLLHPRTAARQWDTTDRKRAADVLAFIREHGPSHPKDVQAAFDHGRRTNAWGGQSNAVTHLLDGMHYRSLLRVVRRDAGVRVYGVAAHAADDRSPLDKAQALVDLVVAKYAPLPSRSLGQLVSLLGGGAPQFRRELQHVLAGARASLPGIRLGGVHWLWPDGDDPASRRHVVDEGVRLLAPFDPIVWDRLRFELLWGWAYRFEAYVPPGKRKLGYYALPLLWHEHVIGWANAAIQSSVLNVQPGFISGRVPRSAAFRHEYEAEVARLRIFLGQDEPPTADTIPLDR